MTDKKSPERFELWSNGEFSITTSSNPHIPKEEGIHLRIFAKREVANGWEDPELCGKAFTLAAKVAGIIVERLKIVQWANLQYNGNWGLLPGYTPVFHIHIYGRKKTGKTWAQPVILPKAPGTYKHEPLTEKERSLLSDAFKKYL